MQLLDESLPLGLPQRPESGSTWNLLSLSIYHCGIKGIS